MKTPATGLEGIADITPPLLPAETGLDPILVFAVTCVLLALITVALVWRVRRTPVARARHQLTRLHAAYRDRQINKRNTSYRIAAILRAGLQQAVISATTPLPARLRTEQQRWNDFVAQLKQARYTRASCDEQQLDALFEDARYWLRHWS